MRRWALPIALIISLVAVLSPVSGSAARVLDRAPGTASLRTASITSTAPVTFAVIGDYGTGDAHERAVANMVTSWNPDFILATGDDYYRVAGGTGTGRYDESTGEFYGRWLKDISTTATDYAADEASVNAFFPALGNHDYLDATPAPATYLTYFDLPGTGFANSSGNERYYDFVDGPVHFFVLNSNPEEPDGTSVTSAQALWLKAQLAASTSRWNIVYDHHPPYSSDNTHGSTRYMEWPFKAWGASVVISGHAHVYERIQRQNDLPYFINGLGGQKRYAFSAPVSGSAIRYSANWGAQRVTASESTLTLSFYSVTGVLVDTYSLPGGAPRIAVTAKPSPSQSAVSYPRKKGVARFTLAAAAVTSRGAPASWLITYLQRSTNGRTGWKNVYRLMTNQSGRVAQKLAIKTQSTRYYRFYIPSTLGTLSCTTRAWRVSVR